MVQPWVLAVTALVHLLVKIAREADLDLAPAWYQH